MSKHALTRRKRLLYEGQSLSIKFLRRNPIIACEMLLGIKLMDSQKYILQESWNKPYVVWNCSRNFGKSFLGDVIIMLKALLYPNQRIYIVSSKGDQAKETFMKMEDIAKQRIDSIPDLKDIFINELVAKSNSDGFNHDKSSFKVELFNGSKIFTLNSIPDNIRGKRANLIFIDESAFCSDELINVVLPFLTQNTNFKIGLGKSFDIKTKRKSVPNQVIYASSAGDIDTMHAKMYKEYAMKMICGDNRYFVTDIPCTVPLKPMVDGKYIEPLLTQQKIDDEMRVNPEKATREYYNKFVTDGGASQFVKWAKVRRLEKVLLPQLGYSEKYLKYIIAFDPARSGDNSVISVMGVRRDEKLGYVGDIINCVNLLDSTKKKKMQLKSSEQLEILRNIVLAYNGNYQDYKNIQCLLLDDGSGGGGVTAYGDNLLEDWIGKDGNKHAGFIDIEHHLYKEEAKKYPNASRKIKLISPKAYRTQMCGELGELIRDEVIFFTNEYNNRGYVTQQNANGELVPIQLSDAEKLALANIDSMKSELTSIEKIDNTKTREVTYDLPKEKKRKMHDDRFYTLTLLAHELYEMRRQDSMRKKKTEKTDVNKIASVFRKPNSYARR